MLQVHRKQACQCLLVQPLEGFSRYLGSNASSTLKFLFHVGQITLTVSQVSEDKKNSLPHFSLYCTGIDCKLFQVALAKITTCLYSAKPSSFVTLVRIVTDITVLTEIEFSVLV